MIAMSTAGSRLDITAAVEPLDMLKRPSVVGGTDRFPHYRLAIFYIYCTDEEVFKRAKSRCGRRLLPPP